MVLRHKGKLLRNFTFGVEDSLVSTVGVLSGVAIAESDKIQIIITGMVLISVEAFSMAVGSLLTERTAEEYRSRRAISITSEIPSALVMFFSYFLSGLIPLSPYLVFPIDFAFWLSIALSLLTLFLLGIFSAKVSRVGLLKSALEMLILGGVAIAIGVLVGRLF